MTILVACEESQAVTIEFRKMGHIAVSCDLLPCSGGHPEWHLQGDVIYHIEKFWRDYDMMIAFPPCTDLAVSGAAHFEKKQADGRQQKSIDFFLKFTKTRIPLWAIENPIGIMSTKYRKPDQIIQPYFFGDPVPKSTCLWLNGLPKLIYSIEDNLFEQKTTVDPEYIVYNSSKTKSGKSKYSVLGKLGGGHGYERSKTFPGIAKAMATQWGDLL